MAPESPHSQSPAVFSGITSPGEVTPRGTSGAACPAMAMPQCLATALPRARQWLCHSALQRRCRVPGNGYATVPCNGVAACPAMAMPQCLATALPRARQWLCHSALQRRCRVPGNGYATVPCNGGAACPAMAMPQCLAT
ncbi:hypothetical protein RF55_24364, partial [Lasius niger]